jgi:hypothetical protein
MLESCSYLSFPHSYMPPCVDFYFCRGGGDLQFKELLNEKIRWYSNLLDLRPFYSCQESSSQWCSYFLFFWMLYASVSRALYLALYQESAWTCVRPITSCSVLNLPKPHLRRVLPCIKRVLGPVLDPSFPVLF